ncbi:MAG: hypothetical protein PF508_01880 [Spirochaeta sp.]|jgi:hypothetical protein|nr:hypothetical protein [Spirochaeta sp.]
MDDERKMSDEKRKPGTELVERSKMVFLREIVEEFQEKQAQYDLQAEFAKTKKNRSYMVPGVILGLIVVFSLVVVAVTQYIQTSSRSIQVNIDDFADVNLRDVLDEAQRLQNELEAVQRELRQTETELADAIERVERERDRAVQLLEDRNLSVAQRNARRQELEAQAASEIESLQAEYQPRIATLQEEIEQLQEQIAQYDSRQLEQAREQEEVLNNQQQIAELEKQQIREQYEAEIERLTATYESEIAGLEQFQEDFERQIRQSHANEIAALQRQHRQALNEMFARYNPQFTEGSLLGLLDRELPTPDDPAAAIAPYSPLLGAEGVANRTEYATLQQRYEELLSIIARLGEIPYEGSVAPAIGQLEQRSYDLIRRYERLWTGLRDSVIDRDTIIAARNNTIDEQRAELDQLLFALEELTRFNGETGYILDPRNPDEIVVYVSRIRTVREGALGYVFRRDDEFIGSVRFVRRDGRMVAELVETVGEMDLRPFDKILVEAQ